MRYCFWNGSSLFVCHAPLTGKEATVQSLIWFSPIGSAPSSSYPAKKRGCLDITDSEIVTLCAIQRWSLFLTVYHDSLEEHHFFLEGPPPFSRLLNVQCPRQAVAYADAISIYVITITGLDPLSDVRIKE